MSLNQLTCIHYRIRFQQTNIEYYAHYKTHLKCYQQKIVRLLSFSVSFYDDLDSSIHIVKNCKLFIVIFLHSDERRDRSIDKNRRKLSLFLGVQRRIIQQKNASYENLVALY